MIQRFFQSCWVVDDIHDAMRRWHETTGTGPFFYMEGQDILDHRYRGEAMGTLNFSVAFGYSGSHQIELIQQNEAKPSAYRDSYAAGSEGFHHLGACPDDYDAALDGYRRQGLAVAQEGVFADQRFCYIDTRATLGWMVELMEQSPASLEFARMAEQAARTWDGTDPYRKIL